MKPSDDLHKLIKSLTKAEKTYFKKFSKRHVIGSKNKYVKLFDEIGKQGELYDENKIKECFKDDPFSNQIHVAKNYLFELILRSLSDLYSEKENEYVLFEYLKKIRILIDKNLSKPALKLIRKGIIKADAEFNYLVLYRLYDLEAMLASRKHTGKAHQELKVLLRKKNEILRQLANTSEYKSYSQLLNLVTAGWSYSKTTDDRELVTDILKNPKIKNENYAAGYSSRYELYNIKLKAYRFLLDDEKSLIYRKKAVDLVEQYPDIIEKYPEKYIGRLRDFINYALATETGLAKKIDIESYIAKMRKQMKAVLNSKKSIDTKSLSWCYYYTVQIGYDYAKVNKENFLKTMEEVKSEISFYREYLRERYLLNFYYYCSISYFEFEMYDESLEWLNKFLNHKKSQDFRELYHTMLMFSIILHYELGNYQLVESLINNTKRYYRNKEELYRSEVVLLAFFRQLISAGKEYSDKIFRDLSAELELLSQMVSEKRFLNSFDFKRWVSKKTGFATA
ncbi:MAG: hypothetical protein JNK43_08555 [Ignavibacteria bacterium]|nr:hypothetical protein [Ignavibacteria bacterium]